ncbi:MAG TPA: hypothetical protein VKX45_03005 [Bryobacteraceae bacterium]|jgi:hypothetical protein|nr:hypothetical protein [Bryobacteraceae bacterium]
MLNRSCVPALALAATLGLGAASAQTPGIYGLAPTGVSPFGLQLISAATGAANPIGPTNGYLIFALAFSPAGTLYAFGNDILFHPLLLTVNPSTAVPTQAALITGIPSNYILSNFAFRADGVLFAYLAGDVGLYTIDTTTGAATRVGTLSAASTPTGLAFSGSGVLYLSDHTNLYTVNQVNANVSSIAPLIFDPAFGAGAQIHTMSFDPMTGKLYAAIGVPGGASFLGVVNPSTGAISRIAATAFGLQAIAIPPSGAVMASSVPALSGAALCLLGLSLVAAMLLLPLRTGHP